ncbi:MAG: hypothetical protein ABIQ12_11400 [Opitutaceae bacterium]
MNPHPNSPGFGAAVVFSLTLLILPVCAAPVRPDRIKAKHQQIEATLVPAAPIPNTWLQERLQAAQVVREFEEAWTALLAEEPPVENVPGKKNGAERKRERDDLVERRDVFLACFAKDKAHELYRFNGGPGKPYGYVIFKQGQSLYQYQLGVNAAP